MKKTILIMVFLACAYPAHADIFLRQDGGNSKQCDGTHNKPLLGAKDTDPNDGNTVADCAWNNKNLTITATSLGQDIIKISGGTLVLTVRPPPISITSAQFKSNPEKYMDMILDERIVYVDYKGKQRRIILE